MTLVIETSTPMASLALVEADGRVVVREFQSDRSHNARMFGPLAGLMAGREPGLVLVGGGPGSYSSTRVGIAAALGVGMAAGCLVVALPSLPAVVAADGGAACLAVGDARRGTFWWARIAGMRMASDPELCDEAGLRKILASARAEGIAVFSVEDPARLAVPGGGAVGWEFPHAERLWRVWQAAPVELREAWAAQAPQPFYLRPPHITPGRRSAWVADGADLIQITSMQSP